jgi:hypothetical protein
VLNDLNTSITSNQLFNIREIKRTYPLVSSGYLVAGVVSGFSLPVLLHVVGLKNVTLISGLMVATGSVLLYYLTEKYRQAFPETAHWTDDEDDDNQEFTARKVTGPLTKIRRTSSQLLRPCRSPLRLNRFPILQPARIPKRR